MSRLSWSAVVLAAGLLAGCGQSSDRVAVYPVEGQLTYNGQPLAGAQVVFHPRNATDPKTLPARAQTDSAGNFKLTTYVAQDGAAAGTYAVTVQFYPLLQWNNEYLAGTNILPPKYAVPTTTDLTVRVAQGPNKLAALNVTR